MRAVLLCLSLVGIVLSHTSITSITINNGQKRTDCLRAAFPPNGEGGIYEQWPINLIGSPDLPDGILSDNYTCGFQPWADSASAAKCDVNAGDYVSFGYYHGVYTGENPALSTWIAYGHSGPIMISMAAITSGDSVKGLRWFKIWQKAILDSDGSKGENTRWASADYLNDNGGEVKFQIPSDLAPGRYIVRAELVALHGAFQLKGHQPYVRCAEVNVKGNGQITADAIQSAGYTMQIPSNEYATHQHPGLKYDLYNPPIVYPYPYPGGDKVYSAGAIAGPTPAPTPSPPAPTPAPTNAPSSSTTGASYNGNSMKSGEFLKQGVKLWDKSNSYYARVKADGRLVVADSKLLILWSSGVSDGINNGEYVLAPMSDGHLVVFQTNVDPWKIFWSAPVVYSDDDSYTLKMQTDGNLVYVNTQNVVVWSTNINIDLGVGSGLNVTDVEDPSGIATASTSSTNGISILIIVASALVALLF